MKDIEYFSEERMSRNKLNYFRENLPSRLKSLFVDSLMGNTKFSYASLQHYGGPSNLRNGESGNNRTLNPEHGVQEIQFVYGMSMLYFVVPYRYYNCQYSNRWF